VHFGEGEKFHMGHIDALLEVTEPLGMETPVFFHINGKDVCPRQYRRRGARMRSHVARRCSTSRPLLLRQGP
jgi:hypothetical protein